MTNVEILREVNALAAVREHLGAIDDYDTQMDALINSLSIDEILSRYCAKRTGTASLWAEFKKIYDALQQGKQQQ